MRRIFIPGSPWLFFKIYTGQKTADALLVQRVLPLAERLAADKRIDKWFFIRYTDPDFHVRLRFHIPDPADYGAVFREFYAAFGEAVEEGVVFRVQCDTYNRELERYGNELIEVSETFFCADSLHLLRILGEVAAAEDPEQLRWCLSLRLVDDLLNAFGFALAEKVEFMLPLSENFKREFRLTTHAFIRQVDDKFRKNRALAESCFRSDGPLNGYGGLLAERLAALAPLAEAIRDGYGPEKGEALRSHVGSLVHMTMNRFFRSANRVYEMVIYDFLYRCYRSQSAREKQVKKNKEGKKLQGMFAE